MISEYMPVVKELKQAYKESKSYLNQEESDEEEVNQNCYELANISHRRADDANLSDGKVLEGDEETCLEPPTKQLCTREEILDFLAKDLDTKEKFGPTVHESFAQLVNSFGSEGMSEEKFKEKTDSILRPENCYMLGPVRVNAEIWNNLRPETRTADIKFQKLLNGIQKGVIPMVQLADTLMETLDGSRNMPSTKSILHTVCNSIAIFGTVTHEVNMRRREHIRPEVHSRFRSVCSTQEPVKIKIIWR